MTGTQGIERAAPMSSVPHFFTPDHFLRVTGCAHRRPNRKAGTLIGSWFCLDSTNRSEPLANIILSGKWYSLGTRVVDQHYGGYVLIIVLYSPGPKSLTLVRNKHNTIIC